MLRTTTSLCNMFLCPALGSLTYSMASQLLQLLFPAGSGCVDFGDDRKIIFRDFDVELFHFLTETKVDMTNDMERLLPQQLPRALTTAEWHSNTLQIFAESFLGIHSDQTTAAG